MLVLYAESGVGKSSLINAGLIPYFRKEFKKEFENDTFIPIIIRFNAKCTQDDNGKDVLKNKLHQQLELYKNQLNQLSLQFIDCSFEHDLWEKVKIFERNNIKLLIIFDQAEEIFTYARDQIATLKSEIYTVYNSLIPEKLHKEIGSGLSSSSQKYTDAELAVYNDELAFLYQPMTTKMLFVVREDKFGAFDAFSDYFIDILKDKYKLKLFDYEQAEKAITAPALLDKKFASNTFSYDPKAIEKFLRILKDEKKDTYDPFSIQLSCSYIERSIVIPNAKTEIKITDVPDHGIAEKNFLDGVWMSLPEKDRTTCKKMIIDKMIDETKSMRIKANENPDNNAITILLDRCVIRESKENDIPYYELSHDRLLAPIIADHLDEQDKNSKRKKLKLGIISMSIAALIIVVALWSLSHEKNISKKWVLFYKGMEYLNNNDLKRAFGIFKENELDDKYIKKKLAEIKPDYSDLPGKYAVTLSNDHVLCIITDSLWEIWSVKSANKIVLEKSYNNIASGSISRKYDYIAFFSDGKLILYDSRTNKDTVLNSTLKKDPHATFSWESDLFSYYANDSITIVDPQKNFTNFKFSFKSENYINIQYNILFATNKAIYFFDNLTYSIEGWKLNSENILINTFYKEMDFNWIYGGNDTVLYSNKTGLQILKLTDETTYLLDKNLAFYEMRKSKNNFLFLFTNNYSPQKNNEFVYQNLTLFDLNKKEIFQPFGSNPCEKIAVDTNYSNYLIKDNLKNVYLIEYEPGITPQKTHLSFLDSAKAYDISPDGKYILYVYEGNKKKEKADRNEKEKSNNGLLYLLDLHSGTNSKTSSLFIDSIVTDPNNSEDTTDIYYKYFYKFSSDSKLFAFQKKINDSIFFVVQQVDNKKIIFKSPNIVKLLNTPNSQFDFTSHYIHAISSKKSKKVKINYEVGNTADCIFLLNDSVRDLEYYLALYPKLTFEEWEKEKKNIGF